MNKSVRIDFWMVLVVIGFSLFAILYYEVRPLTSAVLLFVLPSVYLILRKPKPMKRILFGTVLIGMGIGFWFDILAAANNAWSILSSQLVFSYRIFGFWPLDEAIWFVCWGRLGRASWTEIPF